MVFNSSKISRNDLCPCGSGKKHKKCCLTSSEDILDFSWHKIRQTEGELVDDILMPYVKNHLPPHTVHTAFEDFLSGEEISEETRSVLFQNMFLPWFLFNWLPSTDDLQEREIGLQYLDKYTYRLTPYQKRMLEAFCTSYYSFYVVLDIVPEKSLHLKDIFLNIEHTIKEKQGTHYLKKGHIIFTRLVSLDDQSIGSGIFPYVISSNHHLMLIDMRNSLKKILKKQTLTPAVMREFDNALRIWCFKTMFHEQNNPFPEIRNTDNELFQFCQVHFKIKTAPEEALKKLLPLTMSNDPEDFLEEAEKDDQGNVRRIELSWIRKDNKKMKGWNNPIMGNIVIDGNKMTIDVNSQERAEKVRGIIQDLFKEEATYQSTVIEDIEKTISSPQKSSPKVQSLNHLPEVQEQLRRMAEQQWHHWLDEPLPSLKGKTPRKAVLTADGKEKVEALLMNFEAHNDLKKGDPMNPDISYLKNQLGLS